jgi:hypothetical protein
MPRLPVDGKKVQELRITLGGKERQLLEEISTSYRIEAITGKDSIVEVLGDTTKITAFLASLGFILELLGITDAFDFDEDLQAEADKIKKRVAELAKEQAVENLDERVNIRDAIISILTPGLTPFRIAGFGLDTIRDTGEAVKDEYLG